MTIRDTAKMTVGLLVCSLILSGCSILERFGALARTPTAPSSVKPSVPLQASIELDTKTVQVNHPFNVQLSFVAQQPIQNAQGTLEVFGVLSSSQSNHFTWNSIDTNTQISTSAIVLANAYGEGEIHWTVQVTPQSGKQAYSNSTRLYLLIAPEGIFARSDSTLQLHLDYLDYLRDHNLIDTAEYERRRTAILGGGATTN